MQVNVSWGWHNKAPQTRGFKTTKMYCLPVLEARSPNQCVGRVVLCLKAPGENLIPAFLLASGVATILSPCWLIDPSSHGLLVCVSSLL